VLNQRKMCPSNRQKTCFNYQDDSYIITRQLCLWLNLTTAPVGVP